MTKNGLESALVVAFEDVGMSDVAIVGGKNASLGEMLSNLAPEVNIPTGFATTAHAFRQFLKHNDLDKQIKNKLVTLNIENVNDLAKTSLEIREMILAQPFPADLEQEIRTFFSKLNQDKNKSFAVRSSATAEDLPDASFAGQQETYLNVSGIDNILEKIKEVFSSLYNGRAISYREHHGFKHEDVALSAGIQIMARSDVGSSGVMFTIDTESGFDQVVFITASYGLGETVVQGAVNPDEYYVHKPILAQGKRAIIRKTLGSKLIKMVYNSEEEQKATGELVKLVDVPAELSDKYVLSEQDIEQLARYAVIIEKHYGCALDIEWGKDGVDGEIYILQARPETVKSRQCKKVETHYKLKNKSAVLIEGRAIGQKIGTGTVKVLDSISEMDKIKAGDILVTDMTDPNWEPIMKLASAIVTNRGGRTCHAAIIARELGIPAIVGCGGATETLTDGQQVTVCCTEGDTGYVYEGILDVEVNEVDYEEMPKIGTKIMMNIGNPRLAFNFTQIPNEGVGLARLEFVINNNIGIHPKAILDYPNVDKDLKVAVERFSKGYESPRAFYVDKIKEGISTIAAAFYPKPVIVRLSDFKSNEYRELIGGSRYEPDEENPMLGFRGAARYVSESFNEAFAMECEAVKYVRDEMGLTNVEVMIPFVRTIKQADDVTQLLAKNGLKRGDNGLRHIMMCEVPSNAILAEEFLAFFDGFSIGSNDLTQLTLGLDRDSGLELLAKDFDERDPAVLALIERVIKLCRAENKYIGICGQGPSDHSDFAEWLLKQGIGSISLNPDTVMATWKELAKI